MACVDTKVQLKDSPEQSAITGLKGICGQSAAICDRSNIVLGAMCHAR